MTTTAPALRLPAGVLVGRFEPGSDAWHTARREGIGGSEISAILGLSPYESAFSLWHRKQGLVTPVEQTNAMYWGHQLEPVVCAEYARRHPDQQVIEAGTYHGTGRPWQIVNPDRFLVTAEGAVEVLEAKTSQNSDEWGTEGTDEVPVYYRAQVRWYLDALGLRRARIAVLISGSDYREYTVDQDPADAQLMRDRAEAFVTSLRTGARPPIDGHEATYRAIRQIPDALDDVDIEIDPALRNRYFAALDAAKTVEEEKRHAAGLVLDLIGTGHRAVVAGQRVATRTVRPDGTTKALQPARNRENLT